MSTFISQNLTEIEAVTGCTFACLCHTVFRMFSSLQINWQSHFISASFSNSIHLMADRNLSSNRGPGYSPQNGIAPTMPSFSTLL